MRLEPIVAPDATEHAPFYTGYIGLARAAGALELLRRQPAALRAACAGLSEEESLARYAAGKWSVKEVIGHICDAERIFAYRLLRIARGDSTPLASFEENEYVAEGNFDQRPLSDLLEEFEVVRAATLALLRQLRPAQLERRGTASGHEVSARAVVFIIAGHAEHHMRLLRERYGLAVPLVEPEQPA